MLLSNRILPILTSVTIFLLCGCGQQLLIRKDLPSNEIAICSEMGRNIPDSLKFLIDSVTARFMVDYNNGNNKYHLISCRGDSLRSLYLDILKISITNPGQQAGGVLLTTIGAITPFVMIAAGAPICIWFAYLPHSGIQAQMHLSKDLAADEQDRVRRIGTQSGKYFGSYETQKTLLLNAYYHRLTAEIAAIESCHDNK